MLKEFATIGNKIELEKEGSHTSELHPAIKYRSKLLDFREDDVAVISMPIESGRLVPLDIGDSYQMYIYGKQSLYNCSVTIINRYRNGNIFMLEVRVTSDVVKYQRRQYYRLKVFVDMVYCVIDLSSASETEAAANFVSADHYRGGVMIDLSGGGCKFNAQDNLSPETMVKLKFPLTTKRGVICFEVLGKIISSTPVPNRSNYYEHRVEFDAINNDDREEIVRFIFDQEREQRRKEKGL